MPHNEAAGAQLHLFKSRAHKAAGAVIEGFRKHLGPFVAAAETTRMPMVFTDAKAPNSPIVFANESFLSLVGFQREEVLGQPFSMLVAQGPEANASSAISAALADPADSYSDVCYRCKDGSVLWAATFIGHVLDKKGRLVQRFVSFHDLTKHKEEEERLRLLLDELNHRTQNTLATVQSIAVQTLRGAADDAVVEVFEGRILALSRAHSLLGREGWETVSLREAIGQMLQPFGLDDPRVARFSIEGEDVRLAPKAALTLAMVLHELATNAAKYGALSNADAGKIDIAWEVDPGPEGRHQMRFRWQESGGPPVQPNGHKGFGSRLIEGVLAHELDGEVRLSYGVAGVVCQINMPIPLGLR
jgi:PAS domain S-box-containing protein